jgi:hypothetical protein
MGCPGIDFAFLGGPYWKSTSGAQGGRPVVATPHMACNAFSEGKLGAKTVPKLAAIQSLEVLMRTDGGDEIDQHARDNQCDASPDPGQKSAFGRQVNARIGWRITDFIAHRNKSEK